MESFLRIKNLFWLISVIGALKQEIHQKQVS